MADRSITFVPPDARLWGECSGFGGTEQEALVHEGGEKVRIAFFRKPAGWHLPWHSHTEWTVMTVMEGRMRIEQAAQAPFEAGAGSVYYIPPGVLHRETALEPTVSLVVYDPSLAVRYAEAGHAEQAAP